jgi:hypothetical protein
VSFSTPVFLESSSRAVDWVRNEVDSSSQKKIICFNISKMASAVFRLSVYSVRAQKPFLGICFCLTKFARFPRSAPRNSETSGSGREHYH